MINSRRPSPEKIAGEGGTARRKEEREWGKYLRKDKKNWGSVRREK